MKSTLESTGSEVHAVIFGFSLSHMSKYSQFLICTSGVFLFYLIYGFFQELIFQLEGFKPYGLYLTLIQFICYSVFGYIEKYITSNNERRIPLKALVSLSILTVATMSLSNTSLGYLNYPTQVVFKCCKLIPVLIGGIFIQGKQYGFADFLAAGLMSFGLILFTLTDVEITPKINIVGIVLISLALISDAIIGNYQEKTMREYEASTVEVVFYSYLFGCIFLVLFLISLRQLVPAFLFCYEHPVQTYVYGCIFSMVGYCGCQLVLVLVQTFGVFTAVTVTTFRKALTLVISFLLFSKPFSMRYIWSGLIVIIGIYMNILSKNKGFPSFISSMQDLIRRRIRRTYSNKKDIDYV